MKEELGQLDMELKELFVEEKLEEMMEILGKQPEDTISEMTEYNWNIIKKYHEAKNFELLLKHLKFVAYTCFMVEYAHQVGLVKEEEFSAIMSVYNEIYEAVRQ